MDIAKSILLFVVAAVAEIGGAWLVWQGVREHRGLIWVGAGILALGVYDRITPDNVVNGRVVSGAGTIDGVGNVAAVGGIKEKLVSAERAGAEVFFVPSGNCVDMEGVSARARIVSVSTLDDAINALDALADPATEALVKGCT